MNLFGKSAESQGIEKSLLRGLTLTEQSFKIKMDVLESRYSQKLTASFDASVQTLGAVSPSAKAGTSYFGQWLLFLKTVAGGYADAYVQSLRTGDPSAQEVRTSLYEALAALPSEYADMTWKRICEIGHAAVLGPDDPRPRAEGTFVLAPASEADMDPIPLEGTGDPLPLPAPPDQYESWAPGYANYILESEMSLADSGHRPTQDILIAGLQRIGDAQAVESLLSRWGRSMLTEGTGPAVPVPFALGALWVVS